jgi:hypothetical protein
MKGNTKFWDSIYKCMNNDVGNAFFSYLHTIDLEGYHDQNFPATQAKQDAIVKRLETVAKFIKDVFILRHRDMVINLQNLYDEYRRYCINTGAKVEHKIEFNSRMTKYKLEGKKSGNDHNKFNYKLEYLKEIARMNKWLHKTDVYEATAEELFGNDPLDNNIKYDEKIKDKEIEDLKAQVAELKKQLEKPKVVDPMEQIKQMIIDLEKQQQEMNEYVKEHMKPKKIKIDPKVFELDLSELEDLI